MTTKSLHLRSYISLQWLLTILGAIGIPAIFLPFIMGTSPLSAAFGDYGLWKIALPAFFPLPVTIASIRWLIIKELSRTERMIAYFLSVASIFVTLAVYITDVKWPEEPKERIAFLFPLIITGFGIFILIRMRHKEMYKPYNAILSMQVAYMANSVLCLASSLGQWESGAYLILVTVTAYLTQIFSVFGNFKK